MKHRSRPSAGDLAEEIVRRALEGRVPYVVCLSDPPTPKERLLLAACRLVSKPVAIMPAKCEIVEEWVARYSSK